MHKRIIAISTVVVLAVVLCTAAAGADEKSVDVDGMQEAVKPLIIENIDEPYSLEESEAEPDETDNQEEETVVETEEEPYIKIYYTEDDVIDIAKVLYNECRGVGSRTEQACVAWTILNRVDNQGLSISEVIRAKNQFAFSESTTVDDTMFDLASDVLLRWNMERNGETEVGRTLPKDYTYFTGIGGRNYFRNRLSGEYSIWDYSLESPYEN